MAIALILASFQGIIKLTYQVNARIIKAENINFEAALLQLDEYLKDAKIATVTRTEVKFTTTENEEVKLNQSGTVLRMVKNNGYQPILTHIKTVSFSRQNDTAIELIVDNQKGVIFAKPKD